MSPSLVKTSLGRLTKQRFAQYRFARLALHLLIVVNSSSVEISGFGLMSLLKLSPSFFRITSRTILVFVFQKGQFVAQR